MIVKPNTILPDEGKILHRISDDSYGKGYSGNVDPDDFEEITLDEYGAMLAARSDAEAAARRRERYHQAIVSRIRLRYSLDDELALVHNLIGTPAGAAPLTLDAADGDAAALHMEEYAAFAAYRAYCKTQAAREIAEEDALSNDTTA